MKDPFLYKTIRPIISFLFKIVFRPKIIGCSNIPKTGRIILAGNHTNNLDCIFLISSTKRIIHFLAKDSLYTGFKGFFFKRMGIIPVNRKIHDKNALKSAIKMLNNDKVIGIFPEGTINRTNDLLLPFKIGAVKMAKETNSQIIPFVISGKYKLFNNKLKIEFLNPIRIEDELSRNNEELMLLIRNKIKESNNYD